MFVIEKSTGSSESFHDDDREVDVLMAANELARRLFRQVRNGPRRRVWRHLAAPDEFILIGKTVTIGCVGGQVSGRCTDYRRVLLASCAVASDRYERAELAQT